jgi:hypothetical protein
VNTPNELQAIFSLLEWNIWKPMRQLCSESGYEEDVVEECLKEIERRSYPLIASGGGYCLCDDLSMINAYVHCWREAVSDEAGNEVFVLLAYKNACEIRRDCLANEPHHPEIVEGKWRSTQSPKSE